MRSAVAVWVIVAAVSASDEFPCVANFSAAVNVLPPALFEAVRATAVAFKRLAKQRPELQLLDRKEASYWLDTTRRGAQPRNAIEEAIFTLKQYVQPVAACATLVGAEWWVQDRSGTDGIGFHYDKDESMSTIKRRVKHPAVSTVTYLTSDGAPTLVMEQTFVDWYRNRPVMPQGGYIAFPMANVHVMFSGELQHGVLGSAAPLHDNEVRAAKEREEETLDEAVMRANGEADWDDDSPAAVAERNRRVTLVVNWWTQRPMAPHTRDMDNNAAEALRRAGAEAGAGTGTCDAASAGAGSCRPAPSAPLAVPEIAVIRRNSTRRHQITLPPEQLLFVNVPTKLPAQAYALAHAHIGDPATAAVAAAAPAAAGGGARAPVYRLRWDDDQVLGGLSVLDTSDHALVAHIRASPTPKALFLYVKSDKVAYNRILTSVLPLLREYEGRVEAYLCPWETCGETYAQQFSLVKGDLPRSLVDDPANGLKYTNSPGYRSLTFTRIGRFWKQAFDDELEDGDEYGDGYEPPPPPPPTDAEGEPQAEGITEGEGEPQHRVLHAEDVQTMTEVPLEELTRTLKARMNGQTPAF